MDAKLLVGCAVACATASCDRARAQRRCDITGGWELAAHDPTDRSTNVYLTDRGSGAVDLDQDVRRADGTHGWEVEHGRRVDDRHLEFDAGAAKQGRCEVATACDGITCTSFALVNHLCNIDGDCHATFGRRTGTAHITSHRDDLDLELVGEHAQQVKGLHFTARTAIAHLPEGDARCDISDACDHIACATRPASSFSFELDR